ncbi:MAG: tetratricopeptide repeat protein [Saprospiraceae bacterium]
MSRLQTIVVLSAVVLFSILYFGFSTKPKNHQEIEQKRALNAASTDIRVLLKEAKSQLSPGQLASVQSFEQAIEASSADEEKIQNLKMLSGTWFEVEHPEIAGFYAAQIAEIQENENAWSIAGTTYSICLQRAVSEKVKDFCMEKAVAAFENAISLNPENIDHKLNLAVSYTEYPPKDNPMKGILMLIDLNKKNPDNVGILTNLGRLGIQTGQFEKAIGRLERAISLDSDHRKAYCLLAEAYNGAGRKEDADRAADKCRENASAQ